VFLLHLLVAQLYAFLGDMLLAWCECGCGVWVWSVGVECGECEGVSVGVGEECR
jgi:hypothetical protein